MAREYGFTQQEKDTYYLNKRVYSSWGRDDDDDYIAVFLYTIPDDILVDTIYIPRQDVSISARNTPPRRSTDERILEYVLSTPTSRIHIQTPFYVQSLDLARTHPD